MIFSTFSFFAFYAVVICAFYLLPERTRKPLLLVASYFFYASWNWRFIPLLLILTIVDFVAAIWIEDVQGTRRRVAMLVSVAANLGFLGFFKYFNFASSNFAAMLGFAPERFHLDIVLPLGISFHTFQSISYVVDVYRGQQRAIRRPVDYALFIAFFPQLVAGPIVRAKDFFGDLYAWRVPTREEIKHGSFQIVLGLTKKVVLADNLASVADRYFSSVRAHPEGVVAWGAVVAFAMQIYFDFSGYTDMAIGLARLLGFHFPVNFRRPYLAESITDFWRRWHISLSSWLRDYVYIPLGGSKAGTARTYRNLMLTMLLGGLWHGASWNFVIWGGYHGALLAGERAAGVKAGIDRPSFLLWRVLRVIVTFFLVCLGWVFFRAQSLSDALYVIQRMFSFPMSGKRPIEPVLLLFIGVSIVISILIERRFPMPIDRIPVWLLAILFGGLLFLVELFAPDATKPFVYFQF